MNDQSIEVLEVYRYDRQLVTRYVEDNIYSTIGIIGPRPMRSTGRQSEIIQPRYINYQPQRETSVLPNR